jgi:hypothetical protein
MGRTRMEVETTRALCKYRLPATLMSSCRELFSSHASPIRWVKCSYPRANTSVQHQTRVHSTGSFWSSISAGPASKKFLLLLPSCFLEISRSREIVEILSKMTDGVIIDYKFTAVHVERCMTLVYDPEATRTIAVTIHGSMIFIISMVKLTNTTEVPKCTSKPLPLRLSLARAQSTTLPLRLTL